MRKSYVCYAHAIILMLSIIIFLGLHYKIKYPNFEYSTGRNIRMSPIYPCLKAAGAVFSQSMGYERPCYFRTNMEGKGIS